MAETTTTTHDKNPFHEATEANEYTTTPTTDNEDTETPRNSGIMIHMVPETSKSRWNHIEDLDSFFTRAYNYHQKHGFTVIVMECVFQLLEFAFVIWLLSYTVHCIHYAVLFGNEKAENSKVSLKDVLMPMSKCVSNFGVWTYLILVIAALYFLICLIKAVIHITHYLDIKKFYNSALHLDDNDLDNITWHEIKRKIREVQAEEHMCIDKIHLTELDIYHRILRFKNYMVALMNKNLLPVRFRVPIMGEVVTLSRGLLFNVDLILFRCPGSPFQNNWQLSEDYKLRSNQSDLADRLSRLIWWVAIANLLLAPVIFVWQLIYFSFAYTNIMRKEPSALGMRTWSNYGRLYLRHFNELEHELDCRLNRAYDYADRYLSSFSSPVMAVIAKNLMFLSGGILCFIVALGIYDEYVFQVEHVLTIITVLTAIGLICRNLIPDENLIWCPEQLMTAILAHVHYLPSDWKTQAHTAKVQKEFGHFFQFKASYLLNEICSPLVTPFILLFVFRPKTPEIVKFFRSFTVSVRGVGNVCSFAQMDVRKHGNPEWQLQTSLPATGLGVPNVPAAAVIAEDEPKKRYPVENGKTELSLVRFTLTNPEWQMPQEAKTFLKGIRENAVQELIKAKATTATATTPVANPMTESLLSFGSIGEEYSSITASVFNAHSIPNPYMAHSMQRSVVFAPGKSQGVEQDSFEPFGTQNVGSYSHGPFATTAATASVQYRPIDSMRKMRVSKREGSIDGPSEALLYSIYGFDSKLAKHPADVTVADMCLSTLYLHEVHKRNKKAKQVWERSPSHVVDTEAGTSRSHQHQSNTIVTARPKAAESNTVVTSKMSENTPLLGSIRS